MAVPLDGGFVAALVASSRVLPFVAGFLIGFLIGMEIPLIARVREHVTPSTCSTTSARCTARTTSAPASARPIWVLVCLKLPIVNAAVGAAAANTLVGAGFLIV